MTVPGYLRYPHVRGDLLTFVAEDDVWIAPLSGGRAWRLSADEVPVDHPRFSPDGRWVAWTSRRDGDPEVHVAPAEGGESRRLTYWGAPGTEVCGWTPDGRILAVTSWRQPFYHQTHAYAVPVDGEPAEPMGWGPVGAADVAPDGAVALVTVAGQEPAAWKRYRGGATGRLWVGADEGFRRVLADLDGNLDCPVWFAGRPAFLSDHEGTGRLYSVAPDGTDLRRHSAATDFYARHASGDGERVVYQAAGDLWLVDGLDAEPVRLDVRLAGPRTARHPHAVSPRVRDLSCDHTGRASAVEVHGGVHWITHRDGPARALAAAPGVRARLPRVLGETGEVVWVIDSSDGDALEIAAAAGEEQPAARRRLAAGRLGRVEELAAAPDGGTLAVAAHDGRLLLVDVASGDVRELASNEHGSAEDLTFSPDSAWLAWTHAGAERLSRIRLARVADGTIADVTDGRFADSEPVFTTDGAHLVFLSWRGFDPVFDPHFFDLSFPFGCRPYLVPLDAAAPSPFEPTPEGRPPAAGGDDDKEEDTSATVSLDGIAARVVPVPVSDARYSDLRAVKGGLVWLRRPLTGMLGEGGGGQDDDSRPKNMLERYDLAKRTCEEITTGADRLSVSGDGKRMVIIAEGDLRVLATDGSDDGEGSDAKVDLSRLRVTADPAVEWRHAYDEAGQVMRDYYWSQDMNGVDWDGALARYRPLLDRIATPDDFADLLRDVLGELGSSHAYVYGRRRATGQWLGLLGADLERDDDRLWRVTRILPAETSDPDARSPLAAPGTQVRPGDAVVAVNGRPVDGRAGPGPLLTGSYDTLTELTIAPGAGGPVRRIVVRPLFTDRRLRYQAWVAEQRARVRELGGARLGYLHIPDMDGMGWAQFHRDLRSEIAQEGLVVDVRGNRGGMVSELVVEKLARRVVGWDVGRHRSPVSYPRDAPRGPVVVLADEHTCSDGDVLTAAVRALGLGTVVGTRTWGGVIGIDGAHGLMDGTGITVPRHATWFDGHGWDVENRGVAPDVEVVMGPDDWAAGRDPQLETAVRIALERLAEHPAAMPPPRP
ncbi:S41 family peptidase [Actinoallomurus iriomotensis]|uniref:Tricorn protease homolog n=1 Tax=Actinoallomurus iriomotensis TaxID=478107 RepID=A0A9W6S694_9ACTN|nr:S41 family peptidase [Actinoallomurus iriomotensis]GLY86487.1 tricorn protease [Actinoallomurus iriomotensis]